MRTATTTPTRTRPGNILRALLLLLAGANLQAHAQGSEFVHPPIENAEPMIVEVPEGLKAYDSHMACVNDQRKTRTLLAREFDRSPFSRGEQMERELSRVCRGMNGLMLGPSETALREKIEAFNEQP